MNITEISKKLSAVYDLPERERDEALLALMENDDIRDKIKTAFKNLRDVISDTVKAIAKFVSASSKAIVEERIINENRDFLMQTVPKCYHLAFKSRNRRIRKKNRARLLKIIGKKEKSTWKLYT